MGRAPGLSWLEEVKVNISFKLDARPDRKGKGKKQEKSAAEERRNRAMYGEKNLQLWKQNIRNEEK